MKVKELIEHLQTLDPEIDVFVEGYEGGYDPPVVSEVKTFKLNVHHEWYYGSHEQKKDGEAKGVILQKPNKQ
jgi:hypothetical protein